MGNCVSAQEVPKVTAWAPGTEELIRPGIPAEEQHPRDGPADQKEQSILCEIPLCFDWDGADSAESGLPTLVSLHPNGQPYLDPSCASDTSRPHVTGTSCAPSTTGSPSSAVPASVAAAAAANTAAAKLQGRYANWIAAQPSCPSANSQDEVVVEGPLGTGGYGVVYRGHWHNKAPAAIKVMHTHNNEQEAVRHAFEMAVLSSVQHPNIVSAFSCLTDMVDVDALEAAEASSDDDDDDDDGICSIRSFPSAGRSCAGRRFRRLHPGESVPAAAVCNICVMELCDLSTLCSALERGALCPGAPGSPVDPAAAGQVLLDVASALQYLHSLRLVHGDVKPENVFLKSEPLAALGFVSKLGDFSRVAILDEDGSALGLASGPPPPGASRPSVELVRGGGASRRARRVTAADDVHAFGTLIWEVFTRRCPRASAVGSLSSAPVAPTVPGPYAGLAASCWAADPAARPTMAELAESLEQLVAADIELRGFE